MQAEKFIELLSHPERLDKSSEEQLRLLAQRYPYSQPLRILLAKNLQQLQRPDFEKQVNQAAAAALDRRRFQVFISGRIKPVAAPAKAEAKIEIHKKKKEKTSFFPSWFLLLFSKKPSAASTRGKSHARDEAQESAGKVQQNKIDEIKAAPAEQSVKPNVRKQDAIIEKFLKEEPRINPRRDFHSNENLAEKNLLEPEDIGTETLALIFLKQGLHEKALNIYQKLSLRFPEKSSYFAEKINNIKNEINLKK